MTTLAAQIAALRQDRDLGRLDRGAYGVARDAALARAPAPGPWICGRYDGDLVMGAVPEHRGGVLTAVGRAAGPPPVSLRDLPWLADCIPDVLLAQGPTAALPADLHDVRLHDLRVLHSEEDRVRVRAELWARVIPGPDDLLPVVSPDQAERVPEPRQVATADDGLTVYGPDTRAVEGSGHGAGSGASLGCAAVGCLGVPLLVSVAVALWLVGGPGAVGLWFGGVAVAWTTHGRLPRARQWAGRQGCLGTVGVLGLAAAGTGVLAWWVGSDPCEARPAWWLVPVALPLVSGLVVRWRTTLVLAATAWSYGLWLWSAQPQAACALVDPGLDGRLPVRIAAAETWDHLEEAMAHDPDADLLEHATDIGGDRRLSLDGALRQTDDWTCGVPVHLSGDVLFEEGSEHFTAGAAPHLRRLGRLLRGIEGPVRVEGHGPEAGLSGVRARAVTDWLVFQEGVAEDRLTPLGLGDAHPVVQDSDLARYNRRLDVTRPCP